MLLHLDYTVWAEAQSVIILFLDYVSINKKKCFSTMTRASLQWLICTQGQCSLIGQSFTSIISNFIKWSQRENEIGKTLALKLTQRQIGNILYFWYCSLHLILTGEILNRDGSIKRSRVSNENRKKLK